MWLFRRRQLWDGAKNPSVECPLGDFFGQGWGEEYNNASLPLCAAPQNGRALNSYFPMPFADGARIDIENESEGECMAFYYYVDYEEHQSIDESQGRFHAFGVPFLRCLGHCPDAVETDPHRFTESINTCDAGLVRLIERCTHFAGGTDKNIVIFVASSISKEPRYSDPIFCHICFCLIPCCPSTCDGDSLDTSITGNPGSATFRLLAKEAVRDS